MNCRIWFAAATSLLCGLLGVSALAQGGGGLVGGGTIQTAGTPQVSFNPGQPGGVSIYGHEGSALLLAVYGEKRALLDRQAVVKMTNKSNSDVLWQTTQDGSVATFLDLRTGVYDVEVSAVGYLTTHQDVTVDGRNTTHQSEITLKKDPSAVDLSVQKSEEMPSKVRKNLLQGAAALKSGRLQEAQKKLEAAYKADAYSSQAAFLLGYLYFARSGSKQGQASDLEQAKTYLAKAASLDRHNVQALTLLGRLYIQQNDYAAARTMLEQAVAADPEYWMAHYLLGKVYLQLKEFEKARAQAELAIERGKGGGSAAELILGEALANLGRDQEGIQALQLYLQGQPTSPVASQVRDLIAQLEKRDSKLAEDKQAAIQSPSALTGADTVLAAAQPELSINTWQPAGIDDVKPVVAANASCPYEKVMEGVGVRVKEFVDSVAQFDAIEDLIHEELDELGNPKKSVNLKFDYVASISEAEPGRFIVDEFRKGRAGSTEDFPDQIATRGLPTLALIFHPNMRDNFDMTCEGLGTWNGKATWLVHFRQREDRPHRVQDYIIGNHVYPVSMKGRAWISADTFHIVRLESEMVSPMPEIQLVSEHQIVEYGSVPFPKKNVELWLPKNADLYFDFRRHRYFRRHSFDHFMLFSVDTEEKRKEPKQKAESNGPDSKLLPNRSRHHKTRA